MSTQRVRAALESAPADRAEHLSVCLEDQWFDRKSARTKPKDLGPLLTAFANAEGGVIAIGLDDAITDVDPLLREWQQAAIDFTVPPVRARVEAIECIVRDTVTWVGIIEVEASEVVHETTDGACYLRIGDETRKLSFPQRQELHVDKGQSSFDGRAASGATLEDLDAGLVEAYQRSVTRHLDVATLLANRGLLTRKGEVTHAALLLFGSHPQRMMPNSDVRIVKYRGRDRGHGRSLAIDADADVRIEGTLPEIIERTAEVLDTWVPARRALAASGRFERVPVVPRDVWLEAVVNAVVHRSYSLAGDHTRVEVFDDRIEVTSPGRFPGMVRLDDPEKVARFSRNPRIARVLVDLTIVREMGEGIRRMYAEMRDAGLSDPEYRQTEGSVTVILRSDSRVPDEVRARLPKGALDAVAVLRGAGRPLSTGDVEAALGIARPTAVRMLRALREEGLVTWSGQSPRDPRATWTVAD